jgi:hypothetical protein
MAFWSTSHHEEIRRWVEALHGVPAHVKDTSGDSDDPGLLRIDFLDGPDPNLELISWDELFSRETVKDHAKNKLSRLLRHGRTPRPAKIAPAVNTGP